MTKTLCLIAALAASFSAHAAAPTNAQFIAAAQKGVRDEMKDPGSAEFRNVKVYPKGGAKTMTTVCGEVNAKNSYGGYVGFRPFVASISDKADAAIVQVDNPRDSGVHIMYATFAKDCQ